MKNPVKKKMLFILTAVMCFVGAFGGCAKNNTSQDDPYGPEEDSDKPKIVFSVSIIESPEKFEILSDNPVSVAAGGMVRFNLLMKEPYVAFRAIRQGNDLNADIINEYDGTTAVTLRDIQFSLRATIECVTAETHIAYYPNGGSYIGGGDSEKPYTVGYELKNRYRPNTEIGTDRIKRLEYVLIGWNTQPDGSGEHTGLGSRVTAPRYGTLNLYAEWSRMTGQEDFEYESGGGFITITGYKGDENNVTVPDIIDGIRVKSIAAGAFGGSVKTVILPSTIERLEKGTFIDCEIQELYFYDNILDVSDGCFVNCPYFSTVHINAIEPPRFGTGTLYSEISMADKYDILILNSKKKKIIVFGGSGAYVSVDTMQMEREINTVFSLDEGYVCINMAVNGWFNGAAQFDMMLPYIGEGDIFIHAPESSSPYQLLYNVGMLPAYGMFTYNRIRMYSCLESNYDLFSLIDIRNVTEMFDGFTAFNAARRTMRASSYTDCDMEWIDERGNIAKPRTSSTVKLTGESDIVPEYVAGETAHARLNARYDRIRAAKAEVVFTNAPLNKDTLLLRLEDPQLSGFPSVTGIFLGREFPLTSPDFDSWKNEFETAVKTYLDCAVLVPLSETLYVTEDFWDLDYHLHDGTVPLYTGKIIGALKSFLQEARL